MLVFYNFIEMDQKTIAEKIAEGYDIRVHYLGGDTYVAEFWQDVLVATVNAETQALASTNNPVDRESIKTTFAIDRKSIEEGKQEVFGVGSTVAHAICREFDYDPEEVLKK